MIKYKTNNCKQKQITETANADFCLSITTAANITD